MPVHEQRGTTFTVAIVVGTKEEVSNECERYILEWPPAGYATTISQWPKDLGGDLWEARIRRYSSCE